MRQNSKHCNPAQEILYLTLARDRLVWDPCWGNYLAAPPDTAVSHHNSQEDKQLETSSDKPTEATAAPWSCRARTLLAKQRVAVLSVEVTEFTESSKLFNTH